MKTEEGWCVYDNVTGTETEPWSCWPRKEHCVQLG